MFPCTVHALLLSGIVFSVTKGDSCTGTTVLSTTLEPTFLYSPNYPQHYDNLATCSWLIFPSSNGSRVYVQVLDSDLDNPDNPDNPDNTCSHTLTIHDGVSSTSGQLLSVCGQMSGSVVKSSHLTPVFISFNTGTTGTGRGFALRYWTVPEPSSHPNCPADNTTLVVDVSSTPQRLDFTPASPDCNIRLEAGVRNVIVIRPATGTMQLGECNISNVTVYDGADPVGSPMYLCGSGFTSYTSSHHHVYLQTRGRPSLSLIVERESNTLADCSSKRFRQMEASYLPTYIWLPYTHQSNGGEPCPISAGVTSQGSSSDLVITVLGTSSSTKLNCSVNYFQVSSNSLSMEYLHKPKCSASKAAYYKISESRVVLGRTLNSEAGARYLLQIHAQGYKCSNRSKTAVAEEGKTGTLSLDIPVLHKTDRDERCSFLFQAPTDGYLVNIVFVDSNLHNTGSTSCSGNYFRVNDGANQSSPSLADYCGQDWGSPPSYTSTGKHMHVHLVTPLTGTHVHVQIKYSAFKDNRCNGTIEIYSEEREQFLQSPAFPDPIAQKQECGYLIRSASNHPIILELVQFSLPPDCSDNIAVFDGNSTEAPLLATWCDSVNTTLKTTGPAVTLLVSTSQHSTDTIFSIRYADNIPPFGSPDDPRVPIAIAAIVGLANSVGLVFLLVVVFFYCRNKDKDEDMNTLGEVDSNECTK